MNDDTEAGSKQGGSDAQHLALETRRLAHDLNNALMPLMMGISVLRKKVTDPSLDRTLTNMEKSVHRAGELTNEILSVAHRHSSRSGDTKPE
jgi:signal transduction histidine kinase